MKHHYFKFFTSYVVFLIFSIQNNWAQEEEKVLGPDQRITVYEGLQALTTWAAHQHFEENTKGTLTEGKLADFVILDKNPLKIDPLEIHNIQVLETIKEGETVFRKEG